MRSGESVPLQDFCRIVQGGRLGLSGNDFVQSGFPAYGAGGVNGYLATYEFDEPAVVLSAIGARCGKCFFADGKWISLANTQLIFPDPARADCKFLWYQLNDERRWHRSGTGQPFIKPSDVKAHRVFLPALPEQRRVAEILENADALLGKRRAALAQLDTLTQSIFLDMFGDTRRERTRWPTVAFERIVKETKLGLVRGSQEFGPDFPIPYVRMNAITRSGELELAGVQRTRATDAEVEAYRLESGDFLFNTRNSEELVGKTALYRGGGLHLFNNNVMRIRFTSEADPEFVAAAFKTAFVQHELNLRKSGTTNVFAIYYKDLRSLPLPLPPIELQRDFATRVTAVWKWRGAQSESLAELDALFAVLQHRAFRGEV